MPIENQAPGNILNNDRVLLYPGQQNLVGTTLW